MRPPTIPVKSMPMCNHFQTVVVLRTSRRNQVPVYFRSPYCYNSYLPYQSSTRALDNILDRVLKR